MAYFHKLQCHDWRYALRCIRMTTSVLSSNMSGCWTFEMKLRGRIYMSGTEMAFHGAMGCEWPDD